MSPLNLYRASLCEEECGTGNTESSPSQLKRVIRRNSTASNSSVFMLQENQVESSSTRMLREYKTHINELRKTHTFTTAAALNQMAIKHMSEKSYKVDGSKNNERGLAKESVELAHLTCPSKHETLIAPSFTEENQSTMHNLMSAGGECLKQVLQKASFQFQEPQKEHNKQKMSSDPLCIILKRESHCDLAKLNKNAPLKKSSNVVDAIIAELDGKDEMRRIISVVSLSNIAENSSENWDKHSKQDPESVVKETCSGIKPSVSLLCIKKIDKSSPDLATILSHANSMFMDSNGTSQSEEYSGDSLICSWRTESELDIVDIHSTVDENAETNTPLTGPLICEWADFSSQPERVRKQRGKSSSNVAHEQSIQSVLSVSNIHQLEEGHACFLPDCSDESSVGLNIDF